MRAIIPIAGIGRRLMPLTKHTPKSLIKLRDRPIIREQIDELRNCGIKDIAVVIGYKKEQIINELKDTVKYYYNPDYESTNSIYSLWKAKNFLKGNDILVFNGDLLVEPSIIKELMENESDMCTVVDIGKWNPTGYKVQIKNNRVINMTMDLKKEESSGEYAGMTKISKHKLKDTIKMLDRYIKENRINGWYETAFVSMIHEGLKMDFVDTRGRWWIEIDYKEELDKAREYFKNKSRS